jgi:hypothetical protein
MGRPLRLGTPPALAHSGSNAVQASCLGRSPHWPVLTRPQLAGFQVSTEEHGPGASARTARHRHSTAPSGRVAAPPPAVEIRDLAVYDALLGDTDIAAPLANAAPGASGEFDPTRAAVPA